MTERDFEAEKRLARAILLQQFDQGKIGVDYDDDPRIPVGLHIKGKDLTAVIYFDAREDTVVFHASRKR